MRGSRVATTAAGACAVSGLDAHRLLVASLRATVSRVRGLSSPPPPRSSGVLMPRKATAAVRRERLEAVEAVMRTGGWSQRKARELADRWGVSTRQMWRDRATVLKLWSEGLSREDRETRASRLLEESRALRVAAATRGLRDGDAAMVRCAVQLLHLERDLLGLSTPIEVAVSISQEDPAALAKEVAEVLPFVAGMLGDGGREVIDAAFTLTTDEP